MTATFPVVRVEVGPDLRDHASDKQELQKSIEFHLEYLRNARRIDVTYGEHCSMLAVQFRRAEKYQDAIKSGEKACMVFSEFKEATKLHIAKIRLAHAHQWAGAFEVSEQIFQSCFDDILVNKDLASLLDFTWQHYGKNLFDQKKYTEALDCFERALDLRVAKNDPELIESTDAAIMETLKHIPVRVLH